MIQALIDALRSLAAPRDRQMHLIHKGATPQDLSRAFDDAYMLARDCRQLHWTGAQLDALATLEDTLSAMSAKDNGALWSVTSFQHAKEWQRVRELAARALAALDQEARYR